jgi:hypothetical protein
MEWRMNEQKDSALLKKVSLATKSFGFFSSFSAKLEKNVEQGCKSRDRFDASSQSRNL